ncbi:amidoligase family protein [Microvirga lenta]|uniref:amidoligase family protein n=1 Tax=Microvirga lenta TaxID=2881337 RepID=UPI001CFF5A6C|nr:amidoligase family protein [Microvirga lenta]MCB5176448.1 amidoligase family protein [Microvirga lenta]
MHDIALLPEALNPPILKRADGKLRQVGLEIEFLGASVSGAARAISRNFGGSVEVEDPHAFRICGSRLGDMSIEMDLRHIHPERHPNLRPRLNRYAAAWLGTVISPFVPRELITSPMPVTQLPEMDEVVQTLREAGARGRGAVLLDSLGLHLNIDPPRLDVATITAFLKALLLVDRRLRRETARGSVRLTLALPPEYPKAYVQRVLSPDYWPDLTRFTADYLEANPTRDRALDLLPLLTYLDEEHVRSVLPHEKINPRPAFHYRLPQAHLSDPNWSILPDWERWLIVERLAATPDHLWEAGKAEAS